MPRVPPPPASCPNDPESSDPEPSLEPPNVPEPLKEELPPDELVPVKEELGVATLLLLPPKAEPTNIAATASTENAVSD